MILYAAANDFLSDINVSDIKRFEKEFLEYMDTHYREIRKINYLQEKTLTDEIKSMLRGSNR